MDPLTRQLIEALHKTLDPCALAVTGGGATATGALLSVPGGSRCILEVLVPYHEESLAAFLGHRPASFCSAATSEEMARRALDRARWLRPGERVLGVGCTASLATDRPKRGDHRFHVAVCSTEQATTYSLILVKGARDREGEEAILQVVLLNALAEAAGFPQRLTTPFLPGEELRRSSITAEDPLAGVVRQGTRVIKMDIDGRLHVDANPPKLVVPGAFNPIHEGHWGLAAVASKRTSQAAAFELSVTNVDKPPLPLEEVRRRLAQFQWRSPVWITRAPTFLEKASLFPGATFVVGADTAKRILCERYYGDSVARMIEGLEEIRRRNCRFLVAGRQGDSGEFIGLDRLAVPEAYADLFTEIPEAEFRLRISSTELRGCLKRGQDPSSRVASPYSLGRVEGSCPLFRHPLREAAARKDGVVTEGEAE